jgi:hypothetical protein
MIIDDQDGERHQISVASPTTARTRANPCFSQPTGDSPMTTGPARMLASSAWLTLTVRGSHHITRHRHIAQDGSTHVADAQNRRKWSFAFDQPIGRPAAPSRRSDHRDEALRFTLRNRPWPGGTRAYPP